MTYFRTGAPYYHRRAAVSRSCSGWEGVGPAGYGRQALTGIRDRVSGISNRTARRALFADFRYRIDPWNREGKVGSSRIGAAGSRDGIH